MHANFRTDGTKMAIAKLTLININLRNFANSLLPPPILTPLTAKNAISIPFLYIIYIIYKKRGKRSKRGKVIDFKGVFSLLLSLPTIILR
jgi:hypothetical protein